MLGLGLWPYASSDNGWTPGPQLIALRYFRSWFHCLDAAVIIASFVIDVALRGIIEEVGSAIVVLRLWRVFKIVEEFSAGADEQMDTMEERLEQLQTENQELRKRLDYDNASDG